MAGSSAPLDIVAVPAFQDNYLWLVHEPRRGTTIAVDPGDPAPMLAAARARGWTIDAVWNTHWHPDHSGGNGAIRAATGARLVAPRAEASRIEDIDVPVGESDRVALGELEAEVWAVPGHTLGHVAYVLREAGVAFVGDTLFVMGCGRLFEGSAAQMHAAFRRIAALPDDTRLYCAHEYSLANARFSFAQAPGDAAIAARLARIEAMRARGEPTVPTTVAAERATNLFMRAADAAEFAALRAAKDAF